LAHCGDAANRLIFIENYKDRYPPTGAGRRAISSPSQAWISGGDRLVAAAFHQEATPVSPLEFVSDKWHI
jgi:hypothetical protein